MLGQILYVDPLYHKKAQHFTETYKLRQIILRKDEGRKKGKEREINWEDEIERDGAKERGIAELGKRKYFVEIRIVFSLNSPQLYFHMRISITRLGIENKDIAVY